MVAKAAFPSLQTSHSGETLVLHESDEGISQRLYVATKIMVALIICPEATGTAEHLVQHAYNLTDLLIAGDAK